MAYDRPHFLLFVLGLGLVVDGRPVERGRYRGDNRAET
jgi:hypothetical protein